MNQKNMANGEAVGDVVYFVANEYPTGRLITGKGKVIAYTADRKYVIEMTKGMTVEADTGSVFESLEDALNAAKEHLHFLHELERERREKANAGILTDKPKETWASKFIKTMMRATE